MDEKKLAELVEEILIQIGENPKRSGLEETPLRVAKMYKEIFSGYSMNIQDVIKKFEYSNEGDDIVIVKDIRFYSMCEHHIVPFFGHVSIAYQPDESIIGLSKLVRITNIFSRRLQVQERLTKQIADAVMDKVGAKGVLVKVQAKHMCMMMRGVKDHLSETTTIAARGEFADKEQKAMILGLLKKHE